MSKNLVLIQNNIGNSVTLFLNEKKKLESIIKPFSKNIEHFGSTAIPNTIGKGIIDIMLVCENELDQEKIKNILIANSYYQGELDKKADGRLFFTTVQGQTHAGDIHIHVVIKNSDDHHNALKLREYLLQNPQEVEKYNQEKMRLAEMTGNDRGEYVKQKSDYMEALINKALH